MAWESQQLVVISIVVKKGFIVKDMFVQLFFALPVLHNILLIYFAWKFDHLTCLHILYGYITGMTNCDYYKYFSIAARDKIGGSCDAKVKGKYQKEKS